MHRPPPTVPTDPVIEVAGPEPGHDRISFPVADLASLPRQDLTADFHCVAGWSARDLAWEGVAFGTFYRAVIEPAMPAHLPVSHVVFAGLDGYESVVWLEDALAADVILADRLDGRPLDGDHGAPVRLVSPRQYGFISTKHLSRIELHTSAPARKHSAAIPVGPFRLRTPLISPHRRARVWEEERHAYLPAWLLRPLYQRLIGPLTAMSAQSGTSS